MPNALAGSEQADGEPLQTLTDGVYYSSEVSPVAKSTRNWPKPGDGAQDLADGVQPCPAQKAVMNDLIWDGFLTYHPLTRWNVAFRLQIAD